MSINFQNFQGDSVMGWVNNIKVAYKLLNFPTSKSGTNPLKI